MEAVPWSPTTVPATLNANPATGETKGMMRDRTSEISGLIMVRASALTVETVDMRVVSMEDTMS